MDSTEIENLYTKYGKSSKHSEDSGIVYNPDEF